MYWPLRRLDRANEHIDTLESEINSFLLKKPKPYRIVSEPHPKEPGKIYRMKVREFPPDHISLVLIDCVNHLRSSLDNMVYSFTYWHTGVDPGKTPEFPVCNNEVDYARSEWRVKALPKATRDWIKAAQPMEPNLRGSRPEVHLLWMLDTLWNYDKHRTKSLVAFLTDITMGRGRGSYTLRTSPRVFEDNSIILEMSTQDKLKPKFTVEIGFGTSIEIQYTALAALRNIHDLIRDSIFPEFAGTFA